MPFAGMIVIDCGVILQSSPLTNTQKNEQADIPVFGMMQKLQEEYPSRRDELLELLGVDLKWRMHQVSDGQRRRVQVCLGILDTRGI